MNEEGPISALTGGFLGVEKIDVQKEFLCFQFADFDGYKSGFELVVLLFDSIPHYPRIPSFSFHPAQVFDRKCVDFFEFADDITENCIHGLLVYFVVFAESFLAPEQGGYIPVVLKDGFPSQDMLQKLLSVGFVAGQANVDVNCITLDGEQVLGPMWLTTTTIKGISFQSQFFPIIRLVSSLVTSMGFSLQRPFHAGNLGRISLFVEGYICDD